MGIIRVLHEKVISQIAAGEVIERPASIVRELIDNSLDAGSRKIFIRIERGGIGLIRASDDGAGMVRDDLLLSIERHATSKITSVSELFSISSLGFRGEALPSIGAVSRMEITSRPHDQLSGHKMRVSGGRLLSVDEVGCPPGTTVEVRDLFFNLPARRKFLKGERTETDQILDLLVRMGLPYSHVHFRLDLGDRTPINLPPASGVIERLAAVFGPDIGFSEVETDQDPDFRIKAFLAHPDSGRSRADRILLYVNRRNVRDRLVMHAVMEGYGQRLMKGRYPQAAVFLDVDPAKVDVNVHPAKQEVRLQQGRIIHQALISAVQRGLGRDVCPVSWDGSAPFEHERTDAVQMVLEPPAGYSDHVERGTPPAPKDEFKVIGQFRDTYILLETPEGLLVMDQHAAHERVVYESLRRSYGSSGPEVQNFLIPRRLDLSVRDAGMVTDKLSVLHALGFEIEPFGGTAFLLRSVPVLLVDTEWEKLFSELIPVLEERDPERTDFSDRSLTILACHGAIRAGRRLSHEEMTQLVRQLFATALPSNCPHGRPTLKRFSVAELERLFGRTV